MVIKVRSRRRQLPWTNAFADAKRVNSHLKNVAPLKIILRACAGITGAWPNGSQRGTDLSGVNAESNNVMMLTHAITRYGILPTIRINGVTTSIR